MNPRDEGMTMPSAGALDSLTLLNVVLMLQDVNKLNVAAVDFWSPLLGNLKLIPVPKYHIIGTGCSLGFHPKKLSIWERKYIIIIIII